MPTYEYQCENCGYEFERFQPITARPLRKCPKCQKPALRRLIGTGAAIIFKGNGFYETDYRSESYKNGQKKEKEAADKKAKDKKEKPQNKKPATVPGAKTKARKKPA